MGIEPQAIEWGGCITNFAPDFAPDFVHHLPPHSHLLLVRLLGYGLAKQHNGGPRGILTVRSSESEGVDIQGNKVRLVECGVAWAWGLGWIVLMWVALHTPCNPSPALTLHPFLGVQHRLLVLKGTFVLQTPFTAIACTIPTLRIRYGVVNQ
jgi:hypothetical protein